MTPPEDSVTVIVDRTALPGQSALLETYLKAITAEASKFPGHLDCDIIHPDGTDRYILVFRFASQEELDAWSISEVRNEWVSKIDEIVEEPTKLITLTGLETWFFTPQAAGFVPPPKFKMALITYIAIAPTIMVFNLIFGRFFDFAPDYLAIYLTAPFIVLLMTYLVMPMMLKAFHWFLYPTKPAP